MTINSELRILIIKILLHFINRWLESMFIKEFLILTYFELLKMLFSSVFVIYSIILLKFIIILLSNVVKKYNYITSAINIDNGFNAGLNEHSFKSFSSNKSFFNFLFFSIYSLYIYPFKYRSSPLFIVSSD